MLRRRGTRETKKLRKEKLIQVKNQTGNERRKTKETLQQYKKIGET